MSIIRLAEPDADAAAISEIYSPAVERSIISFEEVAPDAATMASRVASVLAWTPWLVADAQPGVVGYAYASRHRERAGYRWSVDISVYVHPDSHRRGIGRRLYEVLLAILRRQGFVNVYAGVALPNPASVALHQALGMDRVGIYRGVGYKCGMWVDVAWYALRLAEPPDSPPEPTALPDLLRSDPDSLRGLGLTL